MTWRDDSQTLPMLGVPDAERVSLPSVSQVGDDFGGGVL